MNILIVYETQTGTTQYVAEVMQRELSSLSHQVKLHSIRYDGNSPDLSQADLVIFGGPTYDDGLLEKTLREFIQQFHPQLAEKKVAVFGLGNRSYPQFCKAADILEAWVVQSGGKCLVPSLRVDGWPNHLQQVQEWCQLVIQQTKS